MSATASAATSYQDYTQISLVRLQASKRKTLLSLIVQSKSRQLQTPRVPMLRNRSISRSGRTVMLKHCNRCDTLSPELKSVTTD